MIRILYIIILAFVAAITAHAQTAVGTWEQIPVFGGTPQKLVATPDRLYFVSAGHLGSVDTDGGDIRSYSTSDLLSDSKVTDIYYNYDRRFLAIVYEGGNIDLLHDDDRCFNMSDIRDAQLTVEKKVNDIAFHGDRMYVSTNFGMVEFDTERHSTVCSMILDKNVEAMAVLGDCLVMIYDGGLWVSPLSERHNTLARFTRIGAYDVRSIVPVSDTGAICLEANTYGSYQLCRLQFGPDYSSCTVEKLGPSVVLSLAEGKSGKAVAVERNSINYVDPDGSYSHVMLSAEMDGCATGRMVDGLVASYAGPADIWTATSSGISHYSLGADGTSELTLLTGPARPDGTSSAAIGYIYKGPASGNIYLGSMGPSSTYGFYETQMSHIDMRNDFGSYSEITPHLDSWVAYYPYKDGNCYGNFCMVENPASPSMLFIGNFWEGIYRLDLSGKLPLVSFNWTNSPMTHVLDWSCMIPAMAFDPDGNLWAVQSVENSGGKPLLMLPAAKTAAPAVSQSDWIAADVPVYTGDKDARILVSRKSKTVFLTSMLADQVVAIDTRGTWGDLSDDIRTVRTTVTDQDGLQFVPSFPRAIAEDRNGRVWIGHNTGIYEISNPSRYHDADFRVTRLKVPRNDGTNNADYLLNGQCVTSIAVDASNRKWIGTDVSGLYLVSADGSSVIEHFTAENSPLPSNCVYSLYCDDESNRVYIGTSVGLMIYSSDSSPAAPDYSDVYAYPNPVRPDYTGWITVTGLMDNSLVKIADAAGHVFFSGRSNGGMITWDGCDPSGQRVRTGVYYVFASEAPGGGGSGAVTKILVVN